MDYYMYICPNCKKVFKVKGREKTVKCSQCSSFLRDMNTTFDAWNTLTKESREIIKKDVCNSSKETSTSTVDETNMAKQEVSSIETRHSFFDDTKLDKADVFENICTNCGTGLKKGAKFCINCGTPTINITSKLSNQSTQNNYERKGNNAATENYSNDNSSIGSSRPQNVEIFNKANSSLSASRKKCIFVVGGVAIIVLISVICLIVNASHTINLNKYLKIETTGYDGYGAARAVVDWDAIEAKYISKLSLKKAAMNDYGMYSLLMNPIDVIEDNVNVMLSENDGLSNGDKLEYSWKIDDNLSKYINYKIKYKNDNYTVAGLDEIKKVDVFSNLKVEFSEIAPYGIAKLTYTDSDINSSYFICNKTKGLKNGDIVKVSFNPDKIEFLARNFGKTPEALEKDYTVNGLDTYVTKTSDIDKNELELMQTKATEVFDQKEVQRMGDGEELESFTYLGNFLLSTKSPDYNPKNYLILVYDAKIHNTHSGTEQSYDKINDVYWYIQFENVLLGANGKAQVNLDRYNTPGKSAYIEAGYRQGAFPVSWYYSGFKSTEELYDSIIASYSEYYFHENNVGKMNLKSDNTENVETKDNITDNDVITDGFSQAESYEEMLSQLKEAIASGNIGFVSKHFVYEDDKGIVKEYPTEIVNYFVSYMSDNLDTCYDLLKILNNDKYKGQNAQGYVVKLPLMKFIINIGYDNTTVSVSGFSDTIVNSGQSADVMPLLPCVYELRLSNPNWTETVVNKIEPNLDDPITSINIK